MTEPSFNNFKPGLKKPLNYHKVNHNLFTIAATQHSSHTTSLSFSHLHNPRSGSLQIRPSPALSKFVLRRLSPAATRRRWFARSRRHSSSWFARCCRWYRCCHRVFSEPLPQPSSPQPPLTAVKLVSLSFSPSSSFSLKDSRYIFFPSYLISHLPHCFTLLRVEVCKICYRNHYEEISIERLEAAAVVHFSGPAKPWLEIGLPQLRKQ
ncbi:hypothetical protein RIF29_33534 [Crotalaria pallida]|uniref:Uncharacterized protein n=1 Tax=Crotalaria pallida TaxID=3830 RepID=A0AAN9HQR4_CROPI